ncbi:aminopeptidase N [Cyclonatronum proteinivorum]|uniref:Aminopeptidase N n=1 Tax=Cyclonatronum proteinivorum TaxID=1457365 RepID=A0A345UKR3_9BACT|nr:M1 family aminopeptidase [Cyclonatronum proteinivorum]AXJ01065.1 aminopeptidase N [Cyclonatronum proteinivorum]
MDLQAIIIEINLYSRMLNPRKQTARPNDRHAFLVLGLFFMGWIFAGCGLIAQIRGDQPDDSQEVDSVEAPGWIIPEGEPQFLRPRTWNLLHQAVQMGFDFSGRAVNGTTELTLVNLRSVSRELTLDAKTMSFNQIRLAGETHNLSFAQDSATVTIDLGRDFLQDDTLRVVLDFTSQPPNRGLYFIDPDGTDPTRPTQIWTLGQPEDNSFWLPTIDHPAERATQEFWITVPDSMRTVSNGFLISSVSEPESGLRTDYWRLDLPHAPYLFAFAAGVFKSTEIWQNDILYTYYTEPRYDDYKNMIYDRTEDIMAYFEERFDFPYPWGAYGQVSVRDFIARGMENTGATFLYHLAQFDDRGAIDRDNTDLIVHELVHQWFGNLVTTRDWANLPFNEGFANYFEILYKRDRMGYETGTDHSLQHQKDYFEEAQRYRRPIIWNEYQQPEDMYDRHTYAKAGQVLGMLHELVGDEIWWASVRNLLRTHAFSAVDMRDVQHIFETELGESLAWFFDQWFYEPGHPELSVRFENVRNPDTEAHEVRVTITQKQDLSLQPLYRMYAELDIISGLGFERVSVVVSDEVNTFYFPVPQPVTDVIFDPYGYQLAEINEETGALQLRIRMAHMEPAVRYRALEAIGKQGLAEQFSEDINYLGRHDASHRNRAKALALLRGQEGIHVLQTGLQHWQPERQPDVQVRLAALQLLGPFTAQERVRRTLSEAIRGESYLVSAKALRMYAAADYPDAFNQAAGLHGTYSWNEVVQEAVTDALIELGTEEAAALLETISLMPGDRSFSNRAQRWLEEQREAAEGYSDETTETDADTEINR